MTRDRNVYGNAVLVERAIGFRWEQRQNEQAAARDGFSVSQRVAVCPGLAPGAARYARSYAMWRANVRGAKQPSAGRMRAADVQVVQGIIDGRLRDAGLIPAAAYQPDTMQ